MGCHLQGAKNLRGKIRQKDVFHIPLSPKLDFQGLNETGGLAEGGGIFQMVCLYLGDIEKDVGSESPRYFPKRLFPQPL